MRISASRALGWGCRLAWNWCSPHTQRLDELEGLIGRINVRLNTIDQANAAQTTNHRQLVEELEKVKGQADKGKTETLSDFEKLKLSISRVKEEIRQDMDDHKEQTQENLQEESRQIRDELDQMIKVAEGLGKGVARKNAKNSFDEKKLKIEKYSGERAKFRTFAWHLKAFVRRSHAKLATAMDAVELESGAIGQEFLDKHSISAELDGELQWLLRLKRPCAQWVTRWDSKCGAACTRTSTLEGAPASLRTS